MQLVCPGVCLCRSDPSHGALLPWEDSRSDSVVTCNPMNSYRPLPRPHTQSHTILSCLTGRLSGGAKYNTSSTSVWLLLLSTEHNSSAAPPSQSLSLHVCARSASSQPPARSLNRRCTQ